jgi:hypothetical protein
VGNALLRWEQGTTDSENYEDRFESHEDHDHDHDRGDRGGDHGGDPSGDPYEDPYVGPYVGPYAGPCGDPFGDPFGDLFVDPFVDLGMRRSPHMPAAQQETKLDVDHQEERLVHDVDSLVQSPRCHYRSELNPLEV